MSHIELTRRARRRVGSRAGPGPSPDHRSSAGGEGFVDLLRADVVDVDVEGASGEDELLSCDDLCRGTNDERGVDSGHNVWVPGFSYANDVTSLYTNVCLEELLVAADPTFCVESSTL